jgi:hypothetical protein
VGGLMMFNRLYISSTANLMRYSKTSFCIC